MTRVTRATRKASTCANIGTVDITASRYCGRAAGLLPPAVHPAPVSWQHDRRALPESCHEWSVTVAIELVGHWTFDFGSGRHSLVEHRICILDEEMDADRRSTQAMRASTVHLRKFVG